MNPRKWIETRTRELLSGVRPCDQNSIVMIGATQQAIIDFLEMMFGRDTVPTGLIPPEDEPPLQSAADVPDAGSVLAPKVW